MKTVLPPGLAVARDFARQYLTQLCHLGDLPAGPAGTLVEPPAEPDLGALALAAATELEISQPRTGRRKLADEELGSVFGIELAEAPRAPSKVAKPRARKTRATVAVKKGHRNAAR